MICTSGTKLHGLGVEKIKIKCSADYGTPKWTLFGTEELIPKCLKTCTSDEDCNKGVQSMYTAANVNSGYANDKKNSVQSPAFALMGTNNRKQNIAYTSTPISKHTDSKSRYGYTLKYEKDPSDYGNDQWYKEYAMSPHLRDKRNSDLFQYKKIPSNQKRGGLRYSAAKKYKKRYSEDSDGDLPDSRSSKPFVKYGSSTKTNTSGYENSYCKSVSQDQKSCYSNVCSKTALVRRNSRGLEFPQDGSHSGTNRSTDHLPLGHLGNLKCNSGYILNPSEISGEVTTEINVKCMNDEICGGTEWKLIGGSDVPECIEG